MHTVGPGISCETVKNVQNEKCTLYDLEYGKKHWKTLKMRNTNCHICIMVWNSEKGSKWEIHTVWSGIWQKSTEKRGKWEMHTIGPRFWGEN